MPSLLQRAAYKHTNPARVNLEPLYPYRTICKTFAKEKPFFYVKEHSRNLRGYMYTRVLAQHDFCLGWLEKI
jgi:hypothetical protein